MKPQIFDIMSLRQLKKVCLQIAMKVSTPSIILLQGRLGSGKTTFTKYFCQYYGININTVKSPTFSLINVYQTAESQKIFHIDLYRLDKIDTILSEEIKEIITEPRNITLIEWPEKITSDIFTDFTGKIYNLNFNYIPNQKRTLEIKSIVSN